MECEASAVLKSSNLPDFCPFGKQKVPANKRKKLSLHQLADKRRLPCTHSAA
jgi:hypothetical protein